jgi:hypothetical protein
MNGSSGGDSGSAECPGGDDGVPGSYDERRNRQA